MATAKYPAALATADDYTNNGMGRTKSNDKDPKRLDVNFVAEEYNQQNAEIIATQEKIGIDGHDPVGTAGSLDKSFDFLLKHWVPRLDEPGYVETFTMTPGFLTAGVHSPYLTLIGGAAANGIDITLTDALAAAYATSPAAPANTGWYGPSIATNFWHQRSTYMGARVSMSSLPGTNNDNIRIGLYRDATHYVHFYSERAGGSWPVWTVEVNNGGATWNDTLTTGSPADLDRSGAGGFVTFEIRTTSTGAYFYYNRGEVNAEYKGPGTQAPENARSYQFITFNDGGGVGGDTIYMSGSACKDTRSFFGP